MEENDFITELNKWQEDQSKPFVPPPYVKKEYPHVELSDAQKRVIIDYMLGGVSKGIFEDCPEFWDGIADEKIDELYPAYREVSEQFVEQLKQHLLDTICNKTVQPSRP